jgi:hypothetical protein
MSYQIIKIKPGVCAKQFALPSMLPTAISKLSVNYEINGNDITLCRSVFDRICKSDKNSYAILISILWKLKFRSQYLSHTVGEVITVYLNFIDLEEIYDGGCYAKAVEISKKRMEEKLKHVKSQSNEYKTLINGISRGSLYGDFYVRQYGKYHPDNHIKDKEFEFSIKVNARKAAAAREFGFNSQSDTFAKNMQFKLINEFVNHKYSEDKLTELYLKKAHYVASKDKSIVFKRRIDGTHIPFRLNVANIPFVKITLDDPIIRICFKKLLDNKMLKFFGSTPVLTHCSKAGLGELSKRVDNPQKLVTDVVSARELPFIIVDRPPVEVVKKSKENIKFIDNYKFRIKLNKKPEFKINFEYFPIENDINYTNTIFTDGFKFRIKLNSYPEFKLNVIDYSHNNIVNYTDCRFKDNYFFRLNLGKRSETNNVNMMNIDSKSNLICKFDSVNLSNTFLNNEKFKIMKEVVDLKYENKELSAKYLNSGSYIESKVKYIAFKKREDGVRIAVRLNTINIYGFEIEKDDPIVKILFKQLFKKNKIRFFKKTPVLTHCKPHQLDFFLAKVERPEDYVVRIPGPPILILEPPDDTPQIYTKSSQTNIKFIDNYKFRITFSNNKKTNHTQSDPLPNCEFKCFVTNYPDTSKILFTDRKFIDNYQFRFINKPLIKFEFSDYSNSFFTNYTDKRFVDNYKFRIKCSKFFYNVEDWSETKSVVYTNKKITNNYQFKIMLDQSRYLDYLEEKRGDVVIKSKIAFDYDYYQTFAWVHTGQMIKEKYKKMRTSHNKKEKHYPQRRVRFHFRPALDFIMIVTFRSEAVRGNRMIFRSTNKQDIFFAPQIFYKNFRNTFALQRVFTSTRKYILCSLHQSLNNCTMLNFI